MASPPPPTTAVAAAAAAAATHLSPVVEAAIRLLPGNDRCADCKAIFPQWAGVSFGILLCLACAGKHRALGVGASFVKSLAMDSWSPAEQRALEVGGNAKWAAVCVATATTDLPIADKYQTGVANAYKSRVLLVASDNAPERTGITVTDFLDSLREEPSERAEAVGSPLSPTNPISRSGETATAVHAHPPALHSASLPEREPDGDDNGLSVKCTTCQTSVSIQALDAHSKCCVVRASSSVGWRKYDRTLGQAGESLGFSLTKTKGGFAEITRVTPGGAADRAQVLVGSYIVGINGHKTSLFDEIVDFVNVAERPIHFHFAFRPRISTSRPVAIISSVPEPVSVETEVIFEDDQLGCTFTVDGYQCVVKNVDPDGQAKTNGVLVGSRVVEVNGRKHLRASDVLETIERSSRPLKLKFHRVEGLMRVWGST